MNLLTQTYLCVPSESLLLYFIPYTRAEKLHVVSASVRERQMKSASDQIQNVECIQIPSPCQVAKSWSLQALGWESAFA